MTRGSRNLGRGVAWLVSLTALALPACDDSSSGPGAAIGNARAYGVWTPGTNDTCTPAEHNRYSMVGPDRKLYPTWHPPVDPVTGCSFGHEHGRDPRGSTLYRTVGDIPFGLANEALITWDSANQRHEDHVGHKIEWENDFPLRFGSAAASALIDVRCDALIKMHQGTHSKDAFTNNLHELTYHLRCTDGTEMHVTLMTAIGTPGEFTASCDGRTVVVGTATPPNSPDGGGHRRIPDRTCIEQHMLVPPGQESNFSAALHESWETSNSIRSDDGHTLAFFNPYFQANRPSRFHDPAAPNVTGRPIDVCYEVTAAGEQAQGEDCDESTGGSAGVLFDDPRSVFDGVLRFVDINDNRIDNAGGPTVWYTNPFGRNGRTQPFPGSVRQVIAALDNDFGELDPQFPTVGRSRYYGTPQVHAPN